MMMAPGYVGRPSVRQLLLLHALAFVLDGKRESIELIDMTHINDAHCRSLSRLSGH